MMQYIKQLIRGNGPITFESFMEHCLYHPGIGYYTRPVAEIGINGDFYTSPHLHRIFGAMLGIQLGEMWQIMGRPDAFDIVEVGAGRGYLAGDMLDYLRGKPFYDAITYHIVELNPDMRSRQEGLLQGHAGKVKWHASLKECAPIKGCIVTNELLDAFPVHLIEMRREPQEVYVDCINGGFSETLRPLSDALKAYLDEFSITLAEGQKTEINLRARDWIEDASNALERGYVLTIDYGYSTAEYYDGERMSGTLQCYYGHKVNENPYEYLGEQDITAHINFSAVRRWGDAHGLRCDGFTRQGLFLASLGIDSVMNELYSDRKAYMQELTKIKGLIMPGGMGDTHKVMIQSRGVNNAQLKGFSMKNYMDKL